MERGSNEQENRTSDEGRTPARRGFAAMDRDKQKQIASQGGKAAHQQGVAHRWTPEEASEAGRKGGQNSRNSRSGRENTGGR